MRVLAGADFHGNLGIVGWFVEKGRSREVEAIVLAGDQLGYNDEVEDPEEDQTLNAHRVEAMLLEVEYGPLHHGQRRSDRARLGARTS